MYGDGSSSILNEGSWTVDKVEIYRMPAIIYGRCLSRKNKPLSFLRSKAWRPDFFSKTLPHISFKELIRFKQFDVQSSRSERKQTEKFARFSFIWNRFIENCQSYNNTGADITVEAQLFSTQARCSFTRYMANKPDKFGIKFWLAAASKSHYVFNGSPDKGKNVHRPQNQFLSEQTAMELTGHFLNKGRNNTCDNFSISVKLATLLHANKTTNIGTMNRARRGVQANTPEKLSTIVLFHYF